MRYKNLSELKKSVRPFDWESRGVQATLTGFHRNFNAILSDWTKSKENSFVILYKMKITLDRMKPEKAVVDLKSKVNDVYNRWSSELENSYRLMSLMTTENETDFDVIIITDSPEKGEEKNIITLDSSETGKRADPTNEFLFSENLYQMRSENSYIVIDIRSTRSYDKCHMTDSIRHFHIPTEVLTEGLSAATLEQRLDYVARSHFMQRGEFETLILMGENDDGTSRKSETYMVLKIMKEWDPHTEYSGTQKVLFGGIKEFSEKYPGLTVRQDTADSGDEEFLTLDEIVYPPLDDNLMKLEKTFPETDTNNESSSNDLTVPMSSPSVLMTNFFSKPTTAELKHLRKIKPKQEDHNMSTDEFSNSQDSKVDSFNEKLMLDSESDSSEGSKKSSHQESTTLRRTVSTPNIVDPVNEPIVNDMPSFDRRKKPGPMRSSLPEIYDKGLDPVYGQIHPGYTGLKNPGNNCYLNTVIQILAHIPEIRKVFHNHPKQFNLNSVSRYKGSVAEEMARLVKALWSGLYISISANTLKKVVAKYCPRFKGNSQEDCQEFLIILLDYLNEDTSYDIPNQNTSFSESDTAWNTFNKNKRSIVTDLFYGQSQTCIVCENCSHRSTSFQVFACIPLDLVTEDGTVDLRERINKYFKTERLEYKCEKCSYNKCIKKTGISRTPAYLIIQLVRFSEQPGRSFNKSKTTVQIPEFINLSNLTVNGSPASTYRLQSLACHRGVIDCGHYKAYCFSEDTKSFIMFDDTSVTDVGSDIITRKDIQQDAYILLYKLTHYQYV